MAVRRFQQGFTLIELVVTMVVAVILMLIAVPSFQEIIANNRMAANVNSLVTALNLARSEAIKRGVWVTVCQSDKSTSGTPTCSNGSNWEAGWMVFVDNNSNGTFDTGDGQVLRVWGPLSSGETLRGVVDCSGTSLAWVAYQPTGVNQGTSDQFAFTDNRGAGSARFVRVSLGGRVCSYSAATGPANCPSPTCP